MNRFVFSTFLVMAVVATVALRTNATLAEEKHGAEKTQGADQKHGAADTHASDSDARSGSGEHAAADAHEDTHGDTHGGAGHEDAKTPFAGTFLNAATTLIIFTVLLIVLGKFAWGPLLAALQKREEFIKNSLDQAKQDRDEAEKTLRDLTDNLNKAREEASTIVEEGRRDAEALRRDIEAQARTESDAMVERARREIQVAQDTATRELYETAGDLATNLATRILHREISAADHQRFVEESITEIGKLDADGNN